MRSRQRSGGSTTWESEEISFQSNMRASADASRGSRRSWSLEGNVGEVKGGASGPPAPARRRRPYGAGPSSGGGAAISCLVLAPTRQTAGSRTNTPSPAPSWHEAIASSYTPRLKPRMAGGPAAGKAGRAGQGAKAGGAAERHRSSSAAGRV